MYSNDIRTALAAIHEVRRDAGAPGRNFADAAIKLLTAQGYESERTLEDETGSAAEFIQDENGQVPDTESGRLFITEAESARTLFQYTEEEIQERAQSSLFDASEYDKAVSDSFFFIAVELKGQTYPRGRYASFVREVNKQFPGAPAVVLFHTSTGLLSLAFVHHRQNKRDPDRDVLGRVSLIREIDPDKPHRAHLDILDTLSLRSRLDWIAAHGRARNFDGLLDAWLDALDTEELNRRFYRDLFAWFERAVEKATFPTKQRKTLKPEEHVIRLITRLMFVWFVKEKGLVADDLFIENRVSQMLRGYDAESGDSYYRAVLQNLFFATLNTEISRRRFSRQDNSTYRDFSRYRYKSEMADPDGLLALFKQTPFINGGLFDCLDSEEATGDGGYRIDCFSDVKSQRHGYSIPNALFFSEDGKAPGLITLFNRYKFTVEENTPAEQEVALDPELLGKVFENLLAAYNPETRETARKQTGSYYTPREVVDYMVDEALVAALAQKTQPANGDAQGWRETLRRLLDYLDDDGKNEWGGLPDAQRESLVGAIAELKTLDPAVGSGAFPMAVLHKLTLALRRLDPHNTEWERLQRQHALQRSERAFDIDSQARRDEELREISATFQRYRDSDFGRKLYLIQNTIYGVDIQAVATQIAKLRFFISLAIDQQASEDAADNYGIKPLPNLETRFVAANTLIGLSQGSQIPLGGENRVSKLINQLLHNRERHYHAGIRTEKLRLKREDARLRGELAKELKSVGMSESDANRVADTDLLDQNNEADWFDPLYMFSVEGGFDVVIGNPPYVESRNSLITAADKDAYLEQVHSDWSAGVPRGSDLLIYFLARSAKLLANDGLACLITQNAWLSTDYGKKFQNFTEGKFSFHRIIDTSARFFSDSQGPNINAIIALFGREAKRTIDYAVADAKMSVTVMRSIRARQEMKWGHLFAMPEFLGQTLAEIKLRENPTLKRGIRFGQGINVRKDTINAPGVGVPTLLDPTHFVANVADSSVARSTIGKRANNVPALIMPRGIGRYYCAFNSCKAHSFSGVDVYLRNELWESDLHYSLWAFLNSSFAWLFREVTGRRNLGGGMLKAEATDMKTLPIGFDYDFADAARKIYERLQHRTPLPVQQEVQTAEHLAIDEMVVEYFGIAEYSQAIRDALVERVNYRETRAKRRG